MSLTVADARDEILTLFRTAWLADAMASTVPVYYWDVSTGVPDDDYWARVTIQHLTGENDIIGNTAFRRTGLVTVQIFTLFGEGLSLADALAKVAYDAFEGQATPGAAWFRDTRVNEIGHDGKWFNTNVVSVFEYTEVK